MKESDKHVEIVQLEPSCQTSGKEHQIDECEPTVDIALLFSKQHVKKKVQSAKKSKNNWNKKAAGDQASAASAAKKKEK